MLPPARLDLHAHTTYSEDRERFTFAGGVTLTVPFHPVLRPAEAYALALERGMTHVTFTDHDTLAGCLDLLAGPTRADRFIVGEEVSCYYRGISLHVGVYGLTEEDHRTIHEGAERTDRERACLRWNVPELLAYCTERGLAYDLKHPLWVQAEASQNLEVLAELAPRFALFEAINGTRHPWLNDLGVEVVRGLQPAAAFTGGSDSHTDNIGTAWTDTFGETPAEVVASLRAGRTSAGGAHGTHDKLDHDVKTIVQANALGRAGHLKTLTDDYWGNLSGLTRDLVAVGTAAAIAYATLTEYGRQRQLARAVREALAAPVGDDDLPTIEPRRAAPPAREVLVG